MTVAVVSAHLDDAALSASASLDGVAATVITVFAGIPPEGRPAGSWDRLTGAGNSAQRQVERRAEDAAALRLLGARAAHLDELDAQYRDGPPDLDRAVRMMTALLSEADEVWLPAAIGGHSDHVLARNAGLRAAAAAGKAEVLLYADFPYVIAYGWPSWVSGQAADPYLDAGYWLAAELAAVGLDGRALVPAVTRLSTTQRAAKAAVIAAYRSQAPALRLGPADLAGDPGKLDYELSWRMPLAGPSDGRPSSRTGLPRPERERRHHPAQGAG
jgi:LmbE family N-acetylglucosaminyl deacetylase